MGLRLWIPSSCSPGSTRNNPCGESKALCIVPLPVRHCMVLHIITLLPKIEQLVVSHSCTSKVLGSWYVHPKQGCKQPAEELLSWAALQAGQGNRNSSSRGHQTQTGTQWLEKCWWLCRNIFRRNHLKYALACKWTETAQKKPWVTLKAIQLITGLWFAVINKKQIHY